MQTNQENFCFSINWQMVTKNREVSGKSIDLGVFSAKGLKNTFDDFQRSYQRTWQIGAE